MDYAKLGQKIKEIRISSRITQARLAEMVNCNTSHISNIENNHTKISLEMLLSIANSLNTSIDYLLANQYENSSLALDNETSTSVNNHFYQFIYLYQIFLISRTYPNIIIIFCIIYISILYSCRSFIKQAINIIIRI